MVALMTVWVQAANRESAQFDAHGEEGMAFGMARAFSAVGVALRFSNFQSLVYGMTGVHAHAIRLVFVSAAAFPILSRLRPPALTSCAGHHGR